MPAPSPSPICRAWSGSTSATATGKRSTTLSLVPIFVFQLLKVEGAKLVVNYGLNKARFPSPVPSGSRVRMGGEIAAVEAVSGGLQVTLNCTFEIEGQSKPACVAEIVFRYYESRAERRYEKETAGWVIWRW
jgi:acyl dehydratase